MLRSTQHDSPLSFPRTRGNKKGALRSRWRTVPHPVTPERSEGSKARGRLRRCGGAEAGRLVASQEGVAPLR
jgi:hypothetical protein